MRAGRVECGEMDGGGSLLHNSLFVSLEYVRENMVGKLEDI